MNTTLKSLKTAAEAIAQPNDSRGFTAVHRRGEGRGPGVNAQWMAGLLAALAIAAGCVAQQNLSRSSALERASAQQAPAPAETTMTEGQRRFHERLQTGYLDLAMAAYERRAFSIADFFARRSIEAGGPLPPEPIAPDFDAPVAAASARRDFVAHLKEGGAAQSPEQAALAQLAIDCWLRESQMDGALDVRAGCRRQAQEAMASLGLAAVGERQAMLRGKPETSIETEQASAALAALVERWGPALNRSRETAEALAKPVAATLRRRGIDKRPEQRLEGRTGQPLAITASLATATTRERAAPPAPSPAAVETELLLEGFSLDSDVPDADALSTLHRGLRESGVAGVDRVLIEGHADSVGPEAYNLALSRRRAEAVGAALTDALGAKAPPIEIKAYGETRLAVQTGDGVAEPRNRRVVVRFN